MDLKKSFSDLDIRNYTLEVAMPNSRGEPRVHAKVVRQREPQVG